MTRDNLIVPILEGEEADNVVTPGKKWLLKLTHRLIFIRFKPLGII